ncbi:MAG: glycosyltransferase [Ornithinimicrobium sp.]
MTSEPPASGVIRPPEVTIVIPAFRHPERLRVCLEALVRQDYPTELLTVVIVDDGSPQPLETVCSQFTDRLRLRVHRQSNAGPAVARNVGAGLACGALLAFTDDDCEPEPGWVAALAAAHTAYPQAAIGGAVVNALPEQRCAEASHMLQDFLYEWFTPDAPSRFFASNNLAMPRQDFQEVGGFDTTFPRPGGEDRELCERWSHGGRPLVEASAAVVRHSHSMGMGGFCRQHWNYGRGAYIVRRRRLAFAAVNARVRVEPASFYIALMTRPFGRTPLRSAVPLVALLGISQVANAAGFFFEVFSQSLEHLPVPSQAGGR